METQEQRRSSAERLARSLAHSLTRLTVMASLRELAQALQDRYGRVGVQPQAAHEATTELAPIYGRFTATYGSEPLTRLSLTPSRRTVFVFGPKTTNTEHLAGQSRQSSEQVEAGLQNGSWSCALLDMTPFDMLKQLGFTDEHLYHEVCVAKYPQKLVLYTATDAISVARADWPGTPTRASAR